jgi:hypothetical protein
LKYLKLEQRVIQRGQFRGQVFDFKEQLDMILTAAKPGEMGFRTIDEAMKSMDIGERLRNSNGLFEMSDDDLKFIQEHMSAWRPPIADQAVIDFWKAIQNPLSEKPEEFPAEV